MEKEFLEVFRNLELKGELRALLEEVVVTKVAINQRKDHIRIYIRSRQWIHKKYIYTLENTIAAQCFPGVPMKVKILEKFDLSSQYTPELFLDAYRSSMALELKHYSILVFNMFRNAVITFPETDTMHMVLQSNVLAKSKENELIQYIEKVFCERCAFSLKVEAEYQEAKESKVRKNSEIQLQQEAAHIIEMSSFGKHEGEEEFQAAGEDQDQEQKAAEKKTETKEKDGKTEKKKKEEKGTKFGKSFKGDKGRARGDRSFGDFKRSVKRSDNPDVLYGRDFEDEVIPLESIQTEMGEVCVRGQVMTLETREIRNEKTIVMYAVTDFTDTIMVKMFVRNDQLPDILAEIPALDYHDAEARLMGIRGIGKKVANCVLLFGFHRMDAFPIDVWIRKILDRYYPGVGLEHFDPYRALCQQYLFSYARYLDLD